jgi:non-ribosomal peptide synthetase component F
MTAESTWRRELDGFVAATPLWLDKFPCRPPLPKAPRLVHDAAIAAAPALRAVGERHGLALSTLLGAAWGFLIGSLTGERDVIFGQSFGAPVRTLPVRVRVATDATFLDWMRDLEQRQTLLRAYEDVSLDRIREWSVLPREQPLFESLLIDTSDAIHRAEPAGARTPLVISIVPSAGGLSVRVDAEAARFDDWTIARTLDHFLTVLAAIAANPEQRLGDLSLVDDRERQRLVVDWNRTAVEHRDGACIHELFAEQAALRPDAIAVLGRKTTLTYRELDVQSNQLAHYLHKRGVGPDVRVALCLERTPDVIVALLGILKAGARPRCA